jgi:CheY-like chemotaxis protein
MGCCVTTARTGLEAVRAAAARAFDLILMDMQMPEMDGLEATRHIRAAPGPNQSKPILALTANAFVEDAARCKEAGMNEHLTKPIRRGALEAALLRYLGDAAPTDQPKERLERDPAAGGALDPTTWADLQTDMPVEAIRKLANTFLTNQAQELRAMGRDIADGDREALRRRAHSLKGAARLFGATALAKAAAEFEAQALEVRQAEGAAGVEKLAILFRQAADELGRKLAAQSAAA